MQPKEDTWMERFELFQFATVYPAMTVIPLLRRRVGLRTVKGMLLYAPLLVMALLGYRFSPILFGGYALLVLLAAMRQGACRWKELKAGNVWHTRSLGVSWFDCIPPQKLPPRLANWLFADSRIYRYLDPLCVVIIGVALMFVKREFGIWIVVAGACLRIFEEFRWQKGLEGLLDQYDSLVSAEAQNEWLQEVRRPKPSAGQPAATPTITEPPAPKGIADDLREQIAKRKAEAEAREELRRREALAATEAWTSRARETIIIAKESKETMRETVIVAQEKLAAVVIVPEQPAIDAPDQTAALEESPSPPALPKVAETGISLSPPTPPED